MLRLSTLATFFALTVCFVGCSAIINGRIEGRVTDCANQADGKPCAGGDYCFAGTCRYAFCGDGIVNGNRGEECDDGNVLAGDGCQPSTCTHTCDGDTPCPDDGNVCNGPESCAVATHVCSSGPAASGVACTTPTSVAGQCTGGLCVPPGCGDGTVTAPEECDPPGGGCMANCAFECEQAFECPVSDPCVADRMCDTNTHLCVDLGPRNCDDGDPCTADGCSAGVGGCFNNPMDADGDGYAPQDACSPGSALLPKDCDDNNPNVYTGAPEQCNGLDDDCNDAIDDNVVTVTCYVDSDQDDYPDHSTGTTGCVCPEGYRPGRGDGLFDCNDFLAVVNPGFSPGRYSDQPYCADGSMPMLVDNKEGKYSCTDNSTPSYDIDCDGIETLGYPLSQADACANVCDGGGWTGQRIPPCGATDGFGDCYYQFSCLYALGAPRAQSCR